MTTAIALAEKLEEILAEAANEAAAEVSYDSHIEKAIDDYDFTEAIKDATRNYDFTEAIDEACKDFDFTEVAEKAIDHAMDDLEEKVDKYLDSVLPGKVKAVFLGLLEDSDFLAKLTTALFTPWGGDS